MTTLAVTPSHFVAEADRIAEDLLSKAIITSKGLCWPSIVAAYSKDRIVRQPNVSLASGNAGIAVFLLELYSHTDDGRCLEAGQKAVEWAEAECAKGLQGAKSLWFGQLGVVEAFLTWHRATAEEVVLDRAIALALRCVDTYFSNDKSVGPTLCGIGGGAAGALLTLLRLYQQRQDSRLLEASQKLVGLLVRRVRLAPEGIYWDRLGDTIRPPIGFLTGTAGIAFALAQANRIIPFAGCSTLVDLATKYENWLFREDAQNWPDFSYSSWTLADLKNLPKKVRKALKKGGDAFFTETGDSVSWAQGVAGIGLSRASCKGLMDEGQRSSDLERVKQRLAREIDKMESMPLEADTSLGSGLCGVAATCLELSRQKGDPVFGEWATVLGERVAKQRQEFGFFRSGLEAIEDSEDLGLLTGASGVGYLMLRLGGDEISASDLIAPNLDFTEAGRRERLLTFSSERSEVAALSSAFPKTISLIRRHWPDVLLDGAGHERWDRALIEWIEAWLGTFPAGDDKVEVVREVYRIERARFDFDFCEQGDRYLSVKRDYACSLNAPVLEEANEKKLLASKLLLAPEARVLESSFCCVVDENGNPDVQEVPTYYMHHRRQGGVFEAVLPQFNFRVLNAFSKKARVKVVLRRMQNEVSTANSEEREKVSTVALEQIKEALRQGLLTRA